MREETKNLKLINELKRKLQHMAKKAAISSSLILAMALGTNKEAKSADISKGQKSIPAAEVNTSAHAEKPDYTFTEVAFAQRLAQSHSLEFFGNMFYVNDLIRATRAQGYKEQLIKEIADYVFKSGGLSGKSNYCVMSGALSAKQAAIEAAQNSQIADLITKAAPI